MREVEPLIGIEIENHPVRLLDIVDMASPQMQFQHANLHGSDQTALVLDIEIFVGAGFLANADRLELIRKTIRRMLLIKARSIAAAGQRTRLIGRSTICGSIASAIDR